MLEPGCLLVFQPLSKWPVFSNIEQRLENPFYIDLCCGLFVCRFMPVCFLTLCCLKFAGVLSFLFFFFLTGSQYVELAWDLLRRPDWP